MALDSDSAEEEFPSGSGGGGGGERGEETVEGVRTSSKVNSHPNDIFLVGLCSEISIRRKKEGRKIR